MLAHRDRAAMVPSGVRSGLFLRGDIGINRTLGSHLLFSATFSAKGIVLWKKMMGPYQDLYIYEVSGEISDSGVLFPRDLIGCWNEGEVTFLFFSAPHDKEVEAFVTNQRRTLLSRNVLDYRSWQAGEELRPFEIGNLVFCPPWEDCRVGEGKVRIHLDPCVVFGTGHHPTTRSCLWSLWKLYQRECLPVVLDLGTGSGILALAAAKWGARRVVAVDSNELAVGTARRNVEMNHESERIVVVRGKAEDFIGEEADLLCANLHMEAIGNLLEKEDFYRKRWFILSGFFPQESILIENRLTQRSIKIYEKILEEKWVTLVGYGEKEKAKREENLHWPNPESETSKDVGRTE